MLTQSDYIKIPMLSSFAPYFGLFCAVFSPMLSSIGTIFQQGAVTRLGPLITASIAQVLGGLIVLAILRVQKKLPNLAQVWEQRSDLFLMTILRPVLGTLMIVYGLSLTDGIKAIFFTKAEPYFVLFWHWLFERQKVKGAHLILLAVHLLGAVALSVGAGFELGQAQIGDLLILGAMLVLSFSYFPGKRLSHSFGATAANGVSTLLGGLLILPLALHASRAEIWSSTEIGWWYLLAIVILFYVLALTMWFVSLKTVKTWIVSALRATGPLAGAPVAYLVFGQVLDFWQLVGGLVVLATSALIAREQFREQKAT